MHCVFRLGRVLLALSLTACGPKPEEVCDCIRQSANEWMLKGIKPSEAKLLAPCAETMAKLKDNEAAKVKIEADYEDVRRSVEEKKLLSVGGETPAFTALKTTLDSVMADYKQDYEAAQYRYRNRPVLTTVTALYERTDSTAEDGLVATCIPLGTSVSGKLTQLTTRVRMPITPAFRSQVVASSRAAVFDRRRHRTIEKDKRWAASWYDMELGVHMGTLGDKLEEHLGGKQNDLLGILRKEKEASYETHYDALIAEVRAGNYVLLSKGAKTGGEYGSFYFNKLTAKGDLQITGKNGHGQPVFMLKNATILQNEDLLPTLLQK